MLPHCNPWSITKQPRWALNETAALRMPCITAHSKGGNLCWENPEFTCSRGGRRSYWPHFMFVCVRASEEEFEWCFKVRRLCLWSCPWFKLLSDLLQWKWTLMWITHANSCSQSRSIQMFSLRRGLFALLRNSTGWPCLHNYLMRLLAREQKRQMRNELVTLAAVSLIKDVSISRRYLTDY